MISIGVVSLNNPQYVGLLIKSLKRNTRSKFEVLLHANMVSPVTNTFTPIIKTHKDIIKVYTTSITNKGYAEPLNDLFLQAKGDYFCFIDDDMYTVSDWDVPLLNAFDNSLYQYICPTLFYPGFNNKRYGTCIENFEEDNFNNTWKENRDITENSNLIIGNYMIKRELWEHIGGYDLKPNFFHAADVLFKAQIFFKAIQEGQVLRGVNCADSCFYHFGNLKKAYSNCINWQELFKNKYNMSVDDFGKLLGKI